MKSSLQADSLLKTGLLLLALPGCGTEVTETKHETPEKVVKTSSLAPPGPIEPSTAVSLPPTGAKPEPAMPDPKPAETKPAETKPEPPK